MHWLEGTAEEELFMVNGVLTMYKFNNWYYSWLKVYKLNSETTKPLEVERATWTTPSNLLKHYAVVEKVALERGYAVVNRHYDESDPLSQKILWTKAERVVSFGEKKLTLDQNAKNMNNTNRTLTVPAMGDTGKTVATHTTQVRSIPTQTQTRSRSQSPSQSQSQSRAGCHSVRGFTR